QLFGDTKHLAEPRPESLLEPRVPPFGTIFRAPQLRVEREGDVVDIVCGEAGVFEAVADRPLGKLMRVVEVRLLAVLDAVEPLFLDGRDKLAVDEQRSRRLVIDRIDSKNIHRPPQME